MLKLKAPEIPKHSFHGSYNLNPVDLETRGRRTQIALFFPLPKGCGAVLVKAAYPHLVQLTMRCKQHESHLNQLGSWFPNHFILSTCALPGFLPVAFFNSLELCQK